MKAVSETEMLGCIQVQELEKTLDKERLEFREQREVANAASTQYATTVALLQDRCGHLADANDEKDREIAHITDLLKGARAETEVANARVAEARSEITPRDDEIRELRGQLREASNPERLAQVSALEVQLKTTQNEVDVYVVWSRVGQAGLAGHSVILIFEPDRRYRRSVAHAKGQVATLQELLASREAEHRQAAQGLVDIAGKEVGELVDRARQHAEERADREVRRLATELDAQRADYASLEQVCTL